MIIISSFGRGFGDDSGPRQRRQEQQQPPVDKIALETIRAIKDERLLHQISPERQEFGAGAISLNSNCFPLERRAADFRAPDVDCADALASRRAADRLKTVSIDEIERVLLSAESMREAMGGLMLFQAVAASGSVDGFLRRLEYLEHHSPKDARVLSTYRDHLVDKCRFLPEANLSPLLEWTADHVLRPSGFPVPSDPDLLRRQMAVSGTSSMHIHYALAKSCAGPGDKILVPEASFASFFAIAQYCGATTKVIPTADTGYRLTAQALKDSIDTLGRGERPAMLLITNPSNPTGYCYTAKELKEIASVCISRNIVLLVDELYGNLDIPGSRRKGVHAASLSVDVNGTTHRLHDHIVTAWGNSKLYGITDAKIGLGISGNERLIGEINSRLARAEETPTIAEAAMSEELMRASHPFLGATPAALSAAHREFDALMRKTNRALGGEVLRLMDAPHAGYYATLGISSSAARSLGIGSHLQFAEYLARVLGVRAESVESMHVSRGDNVYCRLNFADVDPGDLQNAFARIETWGRQLVKGKAPRIKLDL